MLLGVVGDDAAILQHDFDRFMARYLPRLCRWYRDRADLDVLAASVSAVASLHRRRPQTNADVFWVVAAVQLIRDRESLKRLYAEFVARGRGPSPGSSDL